MNSVGIAIRSNSGTFKNFDTVLEELSGKWSKLSQVQQATAATAIAGTRQHNQFLALMENMNTAMGLQTTEAQSASNAMQRYGTYAQSTEAKFNDLTNTMQKMWMSLINSSAINSAIGLLNNFVKGLSVVTTSSDGTKGAIIALTASTIALAIALKSVGGISALSSSIAEFGVQAAAAATKEAIITSVTTGLVTAIKGVGTALLFLTTTPIGLLITGLGLATAAILHHVNTLKQEKQAVDDTSQSYKSLTQAIKDNSVTTSNADFQKLKKQQDDLTNSLKARATAQQRMKQITDEEANAEKNHINIVGKYAQEKQQLIVTENNATKTINSTTAALNGANVAYNKTTGQIYAVGQAQAQINNNNTVATIKAQSQAEVDHKNQLVSLIQEYQKLSQEEGTNANAKQRMSQIAQQLGQSISGLEVVTDASGNVTIKNTGLLGDEMKALSSEGDSVKTLTNIKLDAAKQSAKIQVGETNISYQETGKRIDQIYSEIQAIMAKKQAVEDASKVIQNQDKMTGLSSLVNGAVKKDEESGLQQQIDNKQAIIKQIQDAKSLIDKTFSTADVDSSLPSQTSFEPDGGDDGSKKKKANTEASKALTAQSRDVANQNRDIAIQSRNLDMQTQTITNQENALDNQSRTLTNQSTALENQSKILDIQKQEQETAMENAQKSEQQHLDDIIKGYNNELDALKAKKDVQDETNQALDYQNKLIKDQQDLNNAQNQKVRVFMDGQWTYQSDTSKVSSARDTLSKDQEDYRRWQADQAEKKQEDSISAKIKSTQDQKDTSARNYNNQKDALDQSYQKQQNNIDMQKMNIQNQQTNISNEKANLDQQKQNIQNQKTNLDNAKNDVANQQNSINDSRNSLAGYADGTDNADSGTKWVKVCSATKKFVA